MATSRPASLAEHHRREKLYYLYAILFYQEKKIGGSGQSASTNV